jgi:signal recognition particle subunit SRP54
MLPGVPKELRNQEIDDRELSRVEAMITSMTTEERRHPDIIDGSRRQRIADGSGSNVAEVNALLDQFRQMQKMMKGFGLGPKKAKKGKKGKKGGRVTPKGGHPRAQGRVPQVPGIPAPDDGGFTLPGL